MKQLCYRLNSRPRRIPTPSPSLYVASNDFAIWTALLNQAGGAPIAGWRRLTGCPPSDPSAIGQVVRLHRLAYEAERDGRLQTANYFWQEALIWLRNTWGVGLAWSRAAATTGNAALTGNELRDLVATELFLDGHLAFANGARASGAWERARVHLRYVESALDVIGAPGRDYLTALWPGFAFEAERLLERKEPAKVLATIGSIRHPVVRAALSDHHALALVAQTMSTGKTIGDRELTDCISELQILRGKVPENTLVYEMLGTLFCARGVRRANEHRFADALVDADRATEFSPQLADATKLLGELTAAMNQLQAKVRDMRIEISHRPDAELNEAGHRLATEADRGFAPLMRFRNSAELTEIRDGLVDAHAAALWRLLARVRHDVPLPPKGELRALHSIVGAMVEKGSRRREDLLALYHARAAEAVLPTLDAERIVDFVLRGRCKSPHRAPAVMGPEPPPSDAVAPSVSPGQGGDRFPARAWVLGRQQLGTRVLAALALAYAAVVAMVGVGEWKRQGIRDRAITEIAATRGDPRTVALAAKRFLQAQPWGRQDSRSAEVIEAYAWGIATWFAQADATTDQEMNDALARYNALAGEGDSQ